MPVNLTRRQQEVLSKLLDLYHEGGEPIHYTTLAKHLRISPVSAYEMLRLLEAHGMVEAEHQRPDQPGGPGRPTIAFRPTLAAIRKLRTLAGSDLRNEEEWQQVKKRILQQIENYRDQDLESLLDKLLEHIPDENVSFPNLASITTAILLNLNLMDEHEDVTNVRKAFLNCEPSIAASLTALIGLGFSFAISKRLYYRLGSLLMSRAGQILASISALNAEKLNRLADLLREVAHL
ncbi:MAG TPA: hypothetical protein PKC99_13405 [Anaerolineales bacterium]|jgi:DNA-binding PadR family transcriptional regulator|nr:MAG: hypothetical protein DCC59_01230 [Chloroflexota bacterium]HMN00003.1 hypothetical protein [Anaerolineales bacterium]